MTIRNNNLSVLYFWDDSPIDEETLAPFTKDGHWEFSGSFEEEQIFYDTFDWRLHAAGIVAEQHKAGQNIRFLVRNPGVTRALASQPGTAPRFVHEHPDLPCCRRLAPLVEMRALLPQIHISLLRRSWALRNRDDKIVLRLHQETLNCSDPKLDTREFESLQLVRLEALKGYVQEFAQAEQKFSVLKETQVTTGDRYMLALQAIGVNPLPPPKKPDVQLMATMPALLALRTLLLQQLEAMEANEAGTREDIDSEFLHDFRVAVRRTRSLLGQLKKVISDPPLQHFRREFAWLGQITGPTRDLDVYLLDFPRYQAALPADRRNDLEPLKSFLQRHQRQEQRLLARRLEGKRYQALREEWREWLQQPVRDDQTGTQAVQPIGEIAARRINKAFKRVIQQGTAIGAESPAEALHELRKRCKKLRYLLEFFASLYAEKAVGKIVKALKGLQNNLGAFQDLAVQAAALREFSVRMTEESQVPPATLLAMGMLIEQLLLRQQEARQQFAGRFADFAADANRERFGTLFQTTTAEGGD